MTKILMFTKSAQFLDELSLRLESRQIKVYTTKSISRLHDLLVCRPFDAVIVDEAFLASRCIVPSKHLWEARSPITIIRYTANESGTITAELFRIPDEISCIASKPGRDEREQEIMEALTKPAPDEIRENESTYVASRQPVRIELPSEQKSAMHRKMRAVLEILERAGPNGASTAEIAGITWGQESKDRTKDIQIYVCKLRHIVARNGYSIRLENGKYKLSTICAENETSV
jgi:DNA-binding response OmpR family regulator